MAQPKATSPTASRELAEKMCARSEQVIYRKISFANKDVPEYLDKLQRFEEESRKTDIVVK